MIPYEYDGLGRFLRISENGGDTLAISIYDNAGRRSRSGWAAATDYTYDPVGRLQSMSHDMAGSSGDHVIGLAYNPASQIVTRSGSNDSYVFAGPAAGRRYTVNGLNQYTAAGPAGFTYDSNGNLTSTASPDGTTSFVYDAENRLVSASGAHTASLVYDPLGRLFQVSGGPAGITQFLYDDDALIGEYDSAGGMPHRYLHGPAKGVDDPIIWYHNSAAGWRQALVSDQQGSIIAVADMYGNRIATNAYDEWGVPRTGNQGRFQYTGQAWIPELGMYHYKARMYSPTLGRFLQTDPIGYKDQMNLYAYVGNDPVNKVDPTGKTCQFNRETKAYQCNVNFNNGHFSKSDIGRLERAYTKAMNRLAANPERQMRVTVGGKSMTVTAGQIASGLADAYVDTGVAIDSRASTVGGTLTPGRGLAGHAHLIINFNALLFDRSGGIKNVDRDLRRTFIHEGIHTTPGERVFQSQFNADPERFNRNHKAPYNDASTVFDNTAPN